MYYVRERGAREHRDLFNYLFILFLLFSLIIIFCYLRVFNWLNASRTLGVFSVILLEPRHQACDHRPHNLLLAMPTLSL